MWCSFAGHAQSTSYAYGVFSYVAAAFHSAVYGACSVIWNFFLYLDGVASWGVVKEVL